MNEMTASSHSLYVYDYALPNCGLLLFGDDTCECDILHRLPY